MFYRIYNSDPKALVTNVMETYITIPPKSFIVVSELVGQVLQTHYAQLEVSVATEEQYKAYRALKDKEVPVEQSLGAVVEPDLKAHSKALKAHLGAVEAQQANDVERAKAEELETIKRLSDTTATIVSPSNCPPELTPRKVVVVEGKKLLKAKKK